MHGKLPLINLDRTQPAGEAPLDLLKVQDFLWRRWRVITATAVTVMVITFIVLMSLTPRYTATALVLLDPRKEKIFGNESIIPEFNLDTSNVDSQISVLKSLNLLGRVVQREKLENDPEFGRVEAPSIMNRLMAPFRSSAPAEAGLPAASAFTQPELRAIGRLNNSLDVQRIGRTYVLSIALTSESPSRAARLANAIADTYVVDQLDARYDAAKRASAWLAERMQGLRAQVQASEEAVSAFRRENNIISAVTTGKGSLNDQQLADLNKELVTARADVAEKKARYDQVVQIQQSGGNLQAIPDVVRSNVITQLRSQQSDVARREADLVARYSGQHPQVVNVRAERRDVERSISAEVGRILSNIKNDYDVAKAREDSLQASLQQLNNATGTDDVVAVKLRELERTNDANKTLFDNFLSRTKLTAEQSSFEEREARLISPATRPGAASYPRFVLIEGLAFVAGLALGVAGAVALDLLNAGFLSPRQLEERLQLPVLSSVPVLADKDRKHTDGTILDPPMYLFHKPLSRYAEAIRAIRVGIQMADVDNPAKTVLVTSSVPQEGKTTVSISLGYSAVKAGLNVLIMDCDLRHPSVSKYFNLDKEQGLVDLLAGTAEGNPIRVVNGLHILPAGSKSQNPPDLLGSARMKNLLAELSKTYEYIIVDSPPIGPVIDSKVLVNIVDKMVYVVRWQSTPREMVEQSIENFTPTNKVAGVILNAVDEDKTPRYGPYSYYAGEYYKKYYTN